MIVATFYVCYLVNRVKLLKLKINLNESNESSFACLVSKRMFYMNQNKFSDYKLDPTIISALQVLKYDEPTKVQQEVMPYLLNKKILSLNHKQVVEKQLLLVFLYAKLLIGKKERHKP